MTDRDTLEKAERVSKIFAAICIPVALGLAGMVATQTLEKSKVKDDLLKKAMEVVFLSPDKASGESKSFEGRRAYRSHWLEIYNSLAEVKLSNDFIAIMMEQDTVASEKELYWIKNLPSMIAKADEPQNTNEDDMGHGWVAVGRLKSARYSDVNFNVRQDAIERDGRVKSGETITARWSVTLRHNTRNLEDRLNYTGTARGLLWGGECAKVIDSLTDGRDQTWAFIEIVQCPPGTKSDRAVGQRAMAREARPAL
jgi:hypothetical protein